MCPNPLRCSPGDAYSRLMGRSIIRLIRVLLCAVLFTAAGSAATKIHIITFGKWTAVPWSRDSPAPAKPVSLKVRALLIDGRVREYAIGTPHQVTERLFVVRRAFRVNDSLPEDSTPRWQWERGGWLLVDRQTGHISPLHLPEFDVFYSAVSWYRDYAAYCGVADDEKKIFVVVAQISQRKPVLKKLLSEDAILEDSAPDSACPAPSWQRSPARVSFEPARSPKQTFAIRGRAVDLVSDAEDEDEASK